MNKLSCISLVFAALAVSVNSKVQQKSLKNSVFISEPYEIVSKQGKSLYSNSGNIAIRNCGGTGKVLQWRSEGCTTSSVGGACLFPAGKQFRTELSFIPSANTDSLGVRTISRVPEEDKAVWQNPFVSKDDSIQAGKEYTWRTTGGVGPEFRGKMITCQLQIYRESDKKVEACAEADFLIV